MTVSAVKWWTPFADACDKVEDLCQRGMPIAEGHNIIAFNCLVLTVNCLVPDKVMNVSS